MKSVIMFANCGEQYTAQGALHIERRPSHSGGKANNPPSYYPAGSLQFRDCVAKLIHYQDVGTVKNYAPGGVTNGEGPRRGAIARPQLSHVIAVRIRHPNVSPVKSHERGLRPHAEGPKHLAVAALQLGHTVATLIGHPDVRSVKSHVRGFHPRGKGPEHSTITGPQLTHIVATLIRHPDVRAVKSRDLSNWCAFLEPASWPKW